MELVRSPREQKYSTGGKIHPVRGLVSGMIYPYTGWLSEIG